MTIKGAISSVAGFSHTKVKECDLFSQNIQFTYKGKDKFTTYFGGIVSIFIMGLWFTYGVSLFIIMINRSDSSKSISTEYRNLAEYDEDIYPYESGFRLMLSVTSMDSLPIPLDPSVLTLHIVQGTYVNFGTTVEFVETELGYELCDYEKELPGIEFDQERAELSNVYWPKRSDFKIAGNYADESY